MDEFIIDRSKLHMVDQLKASLERRFAIKIGYSDVVKEEGKEKQWISIQGDDEPKKTKAKEYLKTVCNADEKVTMHYPEELTPILSKPSNYQRMEEQSGAVILFYSPGEVDILGSDIAVTLALSAVEEFTSHYEYNESELPKSKMTENRTEDLKKPSDARLNSQLKSVCEKHDMPYEDYCNTPSAMKRTLLSWLSNDMDKAEEEDVKLRGDVVADGLDDSVTFLGYEPSKSDSVMIIEPKTKKTPVSKILPVINLFGNEESASSAAAVNVSPVGEMTNVFQKTLRDVGRTQQDSPTVKGLRQFALSRGYSSEEVDEVLQENPDIRLSSILSALHCNRTKKGQKEMVSETEKMDTEQPSTSVIQDPVSNPWSSSQDILIAGTSASGMSSSGLSSFSTPVTKTPISPANLQEEGEHEKDTNSQKFWAVNNDYDSSVFQYFQQLSRDYHEETPALSREDLLKNNAERQKILQQAYEKVKSNIHDAEASEKAGNKEHSSNQTKKARKRRKKKKKQAAASVGNKKPDKVDSSTEASSAVDIDKSDGEIDESSEDDTPDVVIEDEEVQVVQIMDAGSAPPLYARSPRPQSPQNRKKARQDRRFVKELTESEDCVIPKGMQPLQKITDVDRRRNNNNGNQQNFTGNDAARPRHPSGNSKSKSKNQNYDIQQPNVQHGMQQPSFEQYRTYPSAAVAGPSGQQTVGAPIRNRGSCLRPIVIDGSNVAMKHGNHQVFSCRGIQLAIDYFEKRGHTEVTVFVPNWRRGGYNCPRPTVDREILEKLEKTGQVSFTPSRYVRGKKIVCYDDRFILELAAENDGVVVSNDNYRDLIHVKQKWKDVIENRLLMYTFAGNMFMVPDDPLGKNGPTLDQLLVKTDGYAADPYSGGFEAGGGPMMMQPPQAAFPHRQNNPRFAANMNPRMQQPMGRGQPRPHKQPPMRQNNPSSHSLPGPARPPHVTEKLSTELKSIFPDKSDMVDRILENHPSESDLNNLSAYILDASS